MREGKGRRRGNKTVWSYKHSRLILDKEKKTSKTGNHANDLNGQRQRRDNMMDSQPCGWLG